MMLREMSGRPDMVFDVVFLFIVFIFSSWFVFGRASPPEAPSSSSPTGAIRSDRKSRRYATGNHFLYTGLNRVDLTLI